MRIKEKEYYLKCYCGTEIIYKKSECHYNYSYEKFTLECPSCHKKYVYWDTEHELFKEEYNSQEKDKNTKDKEIEKLNNIINELEKELKNRIKNVPDTMAEVYEDENILYELQKLRGNKNGS